MRLHTLSILSLLLILAGCAGTQTPAQRYETSLATYNATAATFHALVETKVLSDQDVADSANIWAAADRQIAILAADYRQNRPLSTTALDTLGNVLQTLQEWIANRQARK